MIRAWWDRRRERGEATLYLKGFQWAAAELWITRTPSEQVYARITTAEHPFDRGALYALRVVQQMQEPTDEQRVRNDINIRALASAETEIVLMLSWKANIEHSKALGRVQARISAVLKDLKKS